MKTIFRVLMLGIILSAVTTVSVFAQDVCTEVEAKQALYKKFTDNYAGGLDQKKAAVDAGDQYISKYGACAEDKQIVDYLNANLPKMKTYISDTDAANAKQKLYTDFDTAITASNTGNIFSTGKAILGKEPDFVDVNIALASAGFDQSVANPPVDTYNSDTINYSKTAIQQIEANKASRTGDYGVKQYSYKTDKYTGKDNALGLLNYNIAYIMYYRQNNKKDALPYFYKSTQYNSFSKTNPFVYQTLGAWYLDQAIKMDADRQAKITAAGDKDTDETIAMLAMQKGYADRAIDAYARAYSLAKNDPKNKPYADGLYAKLNELYKFRYNGNVAGVDTFVAGVMSKPLPDPTTEITPVKEETPAANTTTGTTKTAAMTSDNTANSTASANTMAKPTTKNSASGAAATTPKTPAKPATTPKKKPTR